MHTLMRSLKYACVAMLLGPGLSLVTATAANALSDAREPGSLIIFPYFATGAVTPDGTVQPMTEIHIGVTCPVGFTCPEGEPIKLEAHWVCPGSENPNTSFVCKESDFVLFTTVNGKITVNPNGQSSVGNIPRPPCTHGYLIAWVVNVLDQPIKFDGLFGDAVVRNSSSALAAYDGVTVQAADPDPLHTLGVITTGTDTFTGQSTLIFDGVPGHYTMLTGQLTGDVKFTDVIPGPGIVDPKTWLVFLTVDVQSNFPNNPTFVPLTFYNAKEVRTSTSFNFVCWGASPNHSTQREPDPDGAGHHRGKLCFRAGGEGANLWNPGRKRAGHSAGSCLHSRGYRVHFNRTGVYNPAVQQQRRSSDSFRARLRSCKTV